MLFLIIIIHIFGVKQIHMVRHHLPEFLEDVLLEQCQSVWYVHNGAPTFCCYCETFNAQIMVKYG